jgi:hypothetical protein
MGKTVEVTEAVCAELHRLHGIINTQEAEIERLSASVVVKCSLDDCQYCKDYVCELAPTIDERGKCIQYDTGEK